MNSQEFINSKALRTILYLVQQVGFPIMLSGILLSLFMGWVTSPMTKTVDLLESHMMETKGEAMYRDKLLEELIRAQKATCSLMAKTDTERRICER